MTILEKLQEEIAGGNKAIHIVSNLRMYKTMYWLDRIQNCERPQKMRQLNEEFIQRVLKELE